MTTRKRRILIVDDERNTREGLRRALEPSYDITLADNGTRALELLERDTFDVALTDLRMPGIDGLTFIRRVHDLKSPPTCIMLTAYGSVETAVEAMKAGAYDYLTKPVNLDNLEAVVKRAVEAHGRTVPMTALDDHELLENMVGRSAAMQAVFATIRQVASARTTVLITGESGTGKELAARALHHLSERADQPFIPIHCAALSENLMQSELFGHERGAFTGASERRIGRFEAADGGTVFLDEIGDIGPAAQVALLRFLETRSFERVGGSSAITVDVRVVTATNKNLRVMVDTGEFREDLYYRLDVINIEMPPLRERQGDIPLLLDYYLAVFNQDNNKNVGGYTPIVVDTLVRYTWPGNIRELRNCVERMVVMTRDSTVQAHDLPRDIVAAVKQDGGAASIPDVDTDPLDIEGNERRLILQALRECNGNRTAAARKLGVSRRTIIRKIERYDLDI